jgi:hypothetical protein
MDVLYSAGWSIVWSPLVKTRLLLAAKHTVCLVMQLPHNLPNKRMKKVLTLTLMTSALQAVKDVTVEKAILLISLCVAVLRAKCAILVDSNKKDVVKALRVKYLKIRKSLKHRLNRSYGSTYCHYLQWIAITEVENGVHFKYAMPQNIPRYLNGHVVEAADILHWLNINVATYKDIRTSIQRGQMVLNFLQDRKARGQAWLDEEDGTLVDLLDAFFSKYVIPDPQKDAAKLLRVEAEACMLKMTRYKSIVNSLAKRYQVPLR